MTSPAAISVALEQELPQSRRDAITALTRRVFFPEGTRFTYGPRKVGRIELAQPEERIDLPDGRIFVRPPLTALTPRPNARHFVIWEGAQARCHAMVFDRTIKTGRGPMLIAGLASVCVDRPWQGRGLGALVTRAALDFVVESSAVCTLFQTGVPGFYEKLGARVVDNRFVNRATAVDLEANPFWDRRTMIHPKDADWPSGVIDINGAGF